MKLYKSENKKTYISPEIISVSLDKEISLSIESPVPVGEPDWSHAQPLNFNKDPYNTTLS